jgi:hypothetical protein
VCFGLQGPISGERAETLAGTERGILRTPV